VFDQPPPVTERIGQVVAQSWSAYVATGLVHGAFAVG
jgi:hypothetical protein